MLSNTFVVVKKKVSFSSSFSSPSFSFSFPNSSVLKPLGGAAQGRRLHWKGGHAGVVHRKESEPRQGGEGPRSGERHSQQVSEPEWSEGEAVERLVKWRGIVWVCSGCCSKIPQTGCLLNNRHLFLTVLGAGKSKIKLPAWSCSGEGPLPGS